MNDQTISVLSGTPRRPLRVALIGFGSIGADLSRLLFAHRPQIELTRILVRTGKRRGDDVDPASESLRWASSIGQLLDDEPDVVVECAGHEAVDAYGAVVLKAGCELLVVSVGALADDVRRSRLVDAAAEGASQVLIAPGAVGGLDILSAARLAGLDRVLYRSRKPPQAWRGSPAETLIDLDGLKEATVFFSGTAREASLAYPKNANVAATIALAGLGFDHTRVELIADPAQQHNLHEIEADGASGLISMKMQGLPSPANPKTSLITAYSVMNLLLKRLTLIAV